MAAGRLKDPAKIGASVERALQRNHGYRYYDWELKDGQLTFFEHPTNLSQEKKYEGKYVALKSFVDNTVVACGTKPEKVLKKAMQEVGEPVIVFVPKHNLGCIY